MSLQHSNGLTIGTVERRRLQELIEADPDPSIDCPQKRAGKSTVRARLEALLDTGSFTEIGQLRRHNAVGFGLENRRPWTDGVVAGWGTVSGRTVFVYSQDFRVLGGSLGEAHAHKICKTIDLALSTGAPLICLNDGAGARIQEGVAALTGYGEIFRRHVGCSGVIPQISVILGPCAGGGAYGPALTDFVLMVRGISNMYITGPDVIRTVTGEQVDHEQLGGAKVHAETSGVCSAVYDSEAECLDEVRYLLSLLPSNNRESPPEQMSVDPADRRTERLSELIPADPGRPYDVREVISEIIDDGAMFEVHSLWATNVVCALGRLGGLVVGIVANQPIVSAGVLDIDASEKAARFVQMCDAFNIALITLVDVPGFLPGVAQEHGGIIRHGAQLLYAFCNATVPRVQLILRKAYGGAYIVMNSPSVGADLSFALPCNEVAVMGAEAAVNVIHRRDIAESSDPESLRQRLAGQYRKQLAHPYYAAERGLVDDIIDPASVRSTLVRALHALQGKAAILPDRKHGNPPQ